MIRRPCHVRCILVRAFCPNSGVQQLYTRSRSISPLLNLHRTAAEKHTSSHQLQGHPRSLEKITTLDITDLMRTHSPNMTSSQEPIEYQEIKQILLFLSILVLAFLGLVFAGYISLYAIPAAEDIIKYASVRSFQVLRDIHKDDGSGFFLAFAMCVFAWVCVYWNWDEIAAIFGHEKCIFCAKTGISAVAFAYPGTTVEEQLRRLGRRVDAIEAKRW